MNQIMKIGERFLVFVPAEANLSVAERTAGHLQNIWPGNMTLKPQKQEM
jgi:hypothetical protein